MRNNGNTAEVMNGFDVQKIRADFPVLSQKAYGKPLVYFDNAATSQKPQVVIDALVEYYSSYNANIHRGVHYLSQKASQAFDDVRVKVKEFINASSEREIIFVKGTTEAINLVAATLGRSAIGQDDEIIITGMEHHSNIVPWQLLQDQTGCVIKVIPFNEKGELHIEKLTELISNKTKLISVVHTSNSLGTINPVKEIIRTAHAHHIPVMVDGAQAVAHDRVDVQELNCDFFAFSAHKMLGPTGIGVLYGKAELLEKMPPYQGGGEMINSVSFEKTTYNEIPFKFEAGTPNIADVIALGKAIDYLNAMDRKSALQHEQQLLAYATDKISEIESVRIIGTANEKASVLSFVVDGCNALDIGMFLDTMGIAVRTGHHCCEPVMNTFCIPGTIRASFMFYNTFEEIDHFIAGLKKAIALLQVK